MIWMWGRVVRKLCACMQRWVTCSAAAVISFIGQLQMSSGGVVRVRVGWRARALIRTYSAERLAYITSMFLMCR